MILFRQLVRFVLKQDSNYQNWPVVKYTSGAKDDEDDGRTAMHLAPTVDLTEDLAELADIEVYMLCSDKIAVAARNLERTNIADLNSDARRKFVSDVSKLNSKIIRAFKENIRYEVHECKIDPVGLPSEALSELKMIGDAFGNVSDDFIWILSVS